MEPASEISYQGQPGRLRLRPRWCLCGCCLHLLPLRFQFLYSPRYISFHGRLLLLHLCLHCSFCLLLLFLHLPCHCGSCLPHRFLLLFLWLPFVFLNFFLLRRSNFLVCKKGTFWIIDKINTLPMTSVFKLYQCVVLPVTGKVLCDEILRKGHHRSDYFFPLGIASYQQIPAIKRTWCHRINSVFVLDTSSLLTSSSQ